MKTKVLNNTNYGRYLMNWIGGKSLLRKKISSLIPEDIGSYIEPFGGAAWVLLYRNRWANLEIYNDIDSDLYTLFNVIKYHPEAFIKEFEYMLNSRELFTHSLASKPFTDIQRAAKFFYLIQHSYGAKGTTFATVRDGFKSSGKSHTNIMSRIAEVSKRFDRVYIENLDYAELIERYDCSGAFFYLDPPYIKGADLYKTVDKNFDHRRLYDCLACVNGRWLLSYDDEEEIRELYKNTILSRFKEIAF